MTKTNQQHGNGGGADRKQTAKFCHFANLPVILSLLFVLQFIPFEHIPCLSRHSPDHMMDCHQDMADGAQMTPAQDVGGLVCCRESSPVVFTIPRPESKRTMSEGLSAVATVRGSAVWLPLQTTQPGPPGHLYSVRSVDRTVTFSSFLI